MVVLSDGRHLYIHKFESNESMFVGLFFILKVLTFFFCSVYVLSGIFSVEARAKAPYN